ncbi:MAG: hypothetical protein JWL62_2621 [Hyphomicrobiales bacterium]|nr:hypothetical protein [Hyphomicrobiales bacterium]
MTYGALLVGAEADFNYVSRKSNAASAVFDPAGFYATTPAYTGYDTVSGRKAEWFGTVRARAGFTFDRVLFYATGGLAYGQVGNAGSLVTTGAVDTFAAGSTTSNRFGYALGGGIEYALNDMWTLKGEYLHVHFKDTTTVLTSVTDPNLQFTARTKNSLNLVRLGVNMRF